MRRIVRKSLFATIATSFLALFLFPQSGLAEQSAVQMYKAKVAELNRKIADLDKASQQARQAYAKTINQFTRKQKELTLALQNIQNQHKAKRTWQNIDEARRLAKELNQLSEQFELKATKQIRQLFHIERNRTQRLHQRAEVTMAWSIAFLSQRIDKFQKLLRKIDEATIAVQISRMMAQRNSLMSKRIAIHDKFDRNMEQLQQQEAAALRHFALATPK